MTHEISLLIPNYNEAPNIEAHYLEIDAHYAYFFHAKAYANPMTMTLARVPR